LGSLFQHQHQSRRGQFDSHSALLKDGTSSPSTPTTPPMRRTVHIKLTARPGRDQAGLFRIAASSLPQSNRASQPCLTAVSSSPGRKQSAAATSTTKAQMYNADGSLRAPRFGVDQSSSLATTDRAVSVSPMAVVASWTEKPIAAAI